MEPADLSAIANLKFAELPPIEYDHPVKQAVFISDVPITKELQEICDFSIDAKLFIVGCAAVEATVCRIYLGPRPSWTGLTRHIVIRHELGHCNGWPKDHPGMR